MRDPKVCQAGQLMVVGITAAAGLAVTRALMALAWTPPPAPAEPRDTYTLYRAGMTAGWVLRIGDPPPPTDAEPAAWDRWHPRWWWGPDWHEGHAAGRYLSRHVAVFPTPSSARRAMAAVGWEPTLTRGPGMIVPLSWALPYVFVVPPVQQLTLAGL